MAYSVQHGLLMYGVWHGLIDGTQTRYRDDVLAQWVTMVQATGIPCSDKFELQKVLGEPVKYIVMAYIVMAPEGAWRASQVYSYGLCSYGSKRCLTPVKYIVMIYVVMASKGAWRASQVYSYGLCSYGFKKKRCLASQSRSASGTSAVRLVLGWPSEFRCWGLRQPCA